MTDVDPIHVVQTLPVNPIMILTVASVQEIPTEALANTVNNSKILI